MNQSELVKRIWAANTADEIAAILSAHQTEQDAEIAALKARIEELTAAPAPTEQPTTVEGWLQLLPDGYRERALGQMNQESKGWDCYSTSYALRLFTQWNTTNEDFDFWRDLYDHYALGTPLPELPNN
jgi:hypothetical protein